jgi:hypothetical protein
LGSSELEIVPTPKTIRGVRCIGMVFGIVGSQLISNARPLAAEMVGSAYKIIPTSRHPDYIHRQQTKGAISINAHTFPNSSDNFARWPLSTRAGGLRFHPHKIRLRAWLDYLSF